ncbi:MFS transporter [Liquorilactobacillus uvarum]|uniref:MFS transporter n=1 Tax=Liquorilactobacillus uvarum TaxID=303240 RepID=UPI00070C5CA6|nr:MFS transporter [Liquorilactobacillus uvarum]
MNESLNMRIRLRVIAAILATGLMSFAGVVVETAMNITFPVLMTEFNVTTNIVQWMTTGYLLTVSMIVPLSATLKRQFKTRSLFITANLFFLCGLIIDACAANFPLLVFGRIIQGCGTGIALPLMFNIILEQIPDNQIGMMMGLGTLITAIAPAIGPTFGGIVVASIGWRYIFYLLIPLILISLIIGYKSIEQKTRIQPSQFDFLSVLLLITTFTGLIVGFSHLGSPFWHWSLGGALVLGLLSLLLLIWHSLTIKEPAINFYILGNRIFSGHAIAFFCLQITALGLSFLIPNYVQLVNKSSSTVAGLLVLPGALLGAALAPFSGRILDSLGPKKPIYTGSLVTFSALLLFSFSALKMSNIMILIMYFLYMFGIGLSFGNIMTSGLSVLTEEQQSDGNAILNTLQQFAGATGTSIVSAIVALSQNKNGNQVYLTAIGTQRALIVLSVIILVAILILFWAVARIVKK